MKRIILIAALLFSPLVKSQSRLNFTAQEILDELGSQYKITYDYSKDGDKMLNAQIGQYWVSYWFMDKSTTCNATMILPDTQGALNYLVEQYNKSYVVINATTWRMYSNNGMISDITLNSMDGDISYFLWTPANK
jgi:hypothetical protein